MIKTCSNSTLFAQPWLRVVSKLPGAVAAVNGLPLHLHRGKPCHMTSSVEERRCSSYGSDPNHQAFQGLRSVEFVVVKHIFKLEGSLLHPDLRWAKGQSKKPLQHRELVGHMTVDGLNVVHSSQRT